MSNVCGIDRLIRVLIGLSLVGLALFGEQILGNNLIYGWIGIIPLTTGIFKFCPFYTMLGLKTCTHK